MLEAGASIFMPGCFEGGESSCNVEVEALLGHAQHRPAHVGASWSSPDAPSVLTSIEVSASLAEELRTHLCPIPDHFPQKFGQVGLTVRFEFRRSCRSIVRWS